MAQILLNLPGGQKMPALGLGTWEASDPSELEKALDTALELGYRHIDTAYAYANEADIGKILKKWFASGKLKREDLFITTKLPIFGVHPDRVERFMKESLANLQLDYVDLYLIHFPGGSVFVEGGPRPVMNDKGQLACEGPTDFAALWKKMEDQVDAGRAKAIGLSNFTVPQIEKILKTARIKPANLQIELHVYLQQAALVDFCLKNGITVMAYSPLGSPGYNKFLTKLGREERPLPNILGDKVVAEVAKKHSKTPAQVALRFLLQRGIGAIPKSVTPKRIQENFDVFNFQLDDADMKSLTGLDIGEDARICDWRAFPGIDLHPNYPWK